MKSFLVIGLGRFGTSLSVELCALGNEVMAVDLSEERVQEVADRVTHAASGDARDPEVLRALGARNFDVAVVSVGEDIGTSTLIVLNLKDLGVPYVVSKARSEVHRRVLERIGADKVVFPEQEMALRLARNLSNADVLNFIELSEEYSIVERRCPKAWQGKSIRELDVRAKHRLNIVAVRSRGVAMTIAPGGEYAIGAEDCLVVLGRNEDIERLDRL